MKLSIHGGPGVFYHATFDVYYNTDGFPPAMEQSYIEYAIQVLSFLTYQVFYVQDSPYIFLLLTFPLHFRAIIA